MSSQQSRQQRTTRPSPEASLLGTDTYYSLLNVPYDATRAQITRAYRQSMMRAHPDRAHPSRREAAEDLAKMLNLAYATLSNPVKRKAYDESIRVQALQSEIMGKYVTGAGGFGMPVADAPRRPMSDRERLEQRQSNRGAMISIFSAFVVILLALLALMLIFALVTNGMEFFGHGW